MATVDFDVPLYQLVVIDSMANSGCNIARIRYEVVLAPEAVEDPRRLKANVRANVRDAMETCLRHQPTRASRSRIKRLRGMSRPQYRLRVDEVRVFYDVGEDIGEVVHSQRHQRSLRRDGCGFIFQDGSDQARL